ncbi:MAG TPA: ribonuclease J [Vicinamibacterales bacterium]|nr:ribonuclease J [Vicinamibacterales bacterium]
MSSAMDAEATAPGVPHVDIVPLGGLGEFGLNMMAISCGETTIVVDAGTMFPEPDLLGVDLIIPDMSYLEARRGQIKALVLTHGHEDHIGAVPYILPLIDGPIYGTPLTLAFIQPKLDEHGLDTPHGLHAVKPRDVITVGPFQIEFIRVTHSMPDCMAVAIRTPQGLIIHTGDFKIDQTPLAGEPFDLHRFAQLGAEGVLALFGDSTNIDRRGYTGSEIDVEDAFEEIFTSTEGKIVVAAFSSSLYRMQILTDLAVQFDRKVAFVGRGMNENSQIAQRLGYLRIPAGVQIRDSDVASFPSQDVLCVVTGSQGEPNAALSRIAIDDHRYVKLTPPDRVIISARAIPGNEKAIGRVMNHVAKRGVEVITESDKHVHVSGHAAEEELKLLLALVRPRYFIPIHGEYRQLARHARVAELVTGGLPSPVDVITAETGDVIRFDHEGGRIADKAQVGRVLIDGTRVGEVGDEVLRDRRHLAADGLVIAVVAINRQTGAVDTLPEIVARGFVTDREGNDVLAESARMTAMIIAEASVEERTDPGLIQEKIRVELRRFLRKRTGRRPMVLPIVMEI